MARKNPVEGAKDRAQMIAASRESVAEDERTHGEIRHMEKLIKKIARKKGVK